MGKLPTAKDFFNKRYSELGINHIDEIDGEYIQIAIEFANLHVKEALKEASKKAKTKKDVAIFAEGTFETQIVDKDSILNAYSLKNIK